MHLYLDSSAIVKLIQREAESGVLRRYLRRHASEDRVTSELARVEVVRAILPAGADAISHARRLLSRVHQLALDREILDRAAMLAPSALLCSLDAIHLASAQLLGGELRCVVTYDQRMATAAGALGLPVASPT